MDQKQPTIDELTARFLSRQPIDTAERSGLDVEPYDAVALQPVEPQTAWNGSREVLGYFTSNLHVSSQQPTGWSRVASLNLTLTALPMAAGHFPQAVRDVSTLLQAASANQASCVFMIDDPGVASLVSSLSSANEPSSWFAALGILRMTGQFPSAAKLAGEKAGLIPGDLQSAWDNERAALAWMSGRTEEAKSIWVALPESGPVMFNRGVSGLFGGSAKSALGHFKKAIARFPESSGWHHLAQLYLAIAESR